MPVDKSPVFAVLNAVAAKEGVSVVNLPPINKSVDPDALETLVTETKSSVRIEFQYLEYQVTITATGDIEIDEIDSDDADVTAQSGCC
jgi:hypothetical protein